MPGVCYKYRPDARARPRSSLSESASRALGGQPREAAALESWSLRQEEGALAIKACLPGPWARLLRPLLPRRQRLPGRPWRPVRVRPLSAPWPGRSWTGGSATSAACLPASEARSPRRGGQSSVRGGREVVSSPGCSSGFAPAQHPRTLSIFWSSVSSAAWIPARLTLRMLAASSMVMPWLRVIASTLPARPPEVPAAPPAASPPARASEGGVQEESERAEGRRLRRRGAGTDCARLVAMPGQRPCRGSASRG